jgi:DNA-directed RNA polymerase subunit K/omega
MAKSKRKPSKFAAAREARRRARELAGPPPAARVIPDKRWKPTKHKKHPLEEGT